MSLIQSRSAAASRIRLRDVGLAAERAVGYGVAAVRIVQIARLARAEDAERTR